MNTLLESLATRFIEKKSCESRTSNYTLKVEPRIEEETKMIWRRKCLMVATFAILVLRQSLEITHKVLYLYLNFEAKNMLSTLEIMLSITRLFVAIVKYKVFENYSKSINFLHSK